ncbi:MAG: HAMP domain-containing sensor histidine kinase [Desulfuromonadaceae bacterium]|nr:HAMP domain-containing sensor histidine kinase [Desulfuromonadaceae bacterium]MDD5105285.1 HAMP domain-containing sensor histidine kinase [Desulfuromonadaceae bacterium]
MNMTDDALIEELSKRFAVSRKAFSDLSVVNRTLQEMNERLTRSESLKSNFLSNIRNEINNPLNVIMGLAGQLVQIATGNEDVTSLASLIGAEANHLDFQLRNIFIAAELEAGEVSPRCVKVHIESALRDLVDLFLHTAAKKNVSLDLALPPAEDASIVVIDFEKFQIIVSNLLANAIEYSVDGGAVEISFSVGGDGCLQVFVQDHGVGIAAEDQKRIFDRFVQMETGTTRSHLGHGLGLSISKALVDLMQGTITLVSARGEGTCFTVTLPPCSLMEDNDSFSEAGNLFLFDDMSEAQPR